MKASDSNEGQSASERIDKIVADLGDWRGETFETGEKIDAIAFKALIRAAVALNTSGGKATSERA